MQLNKFSLMKKTDTGMDKKNCYRLSELSVGEFKILMQVVDLDSKEIGDYKKNGYLDFVSTDYQILQQALAQYHRVLTQPEDAVLVHEMLVKMDEFDTQQAILETHHLNWQWRGFWALWLIGTFFYVLFAGLLGLDLLNQLQQVHHSLHLAWQHNDFQLAVMLLVGLTIVWIVLGGMGLYRLKFSLNFYNLYHPHHPKYKTTNHKDGMFTPISKYEYQSQPAQHWNYNFKYVE